MEIDKWKIWSSVYSSKVSGCALKGVNDPIPRLELQAAVLASRLAKSNQEETRLKILRTTFFFDSRVTLAWMQGMLRSYKPFVSCRVSEIRSNSNPTDWYH